MMMEREEDLQEKRLPPLRWWTLESKAESDRTALLAMFQDEATWKLHRRVKRCDTPHAREPG